VNEKMTDQIIKAMKGWETGPQPPAVMDINPTDYCNLKCKSCWQRNWKFRNLDSKHYQVPDERLLTLVKEAAELGVKKVMVTGGGEPLMRPITKEIMRLIKKSGMEGELTTNGTMIDEGFAKELVDMAWDKIVFSIDGGTEETNDLLRGRGTYHKVYSALKAIKSHRGLKERPRIAFNTVVSKANHDKLDQIIILAHETGADAVMFEPLTVHSWRGWLMKSGRGDKKRIATAIGNISRLAEELGIHTNIGALARSEFIEQSNRMDKLIIKENRIGQDDKTSNGPACFEPWYHLVVKVDGSVGPCCVFEEKSLNIKTMSLNDVWYGDWFNAMRKRMQNGDLPNWCKICNTTQIQKNIAIRNSLGEKNRRRGSKADE